MSDLYTKIRAQSRSHAYPRPNLLGVPLRDPHVRRHDPLLYVLLALMLVVLVLFFAGPSLAAQPIRKVLAFGDSITRGPIPEDGTSYPALLERELAGIPVFNAGLPGDVSTNLDRFVAMLEQEAPDLVLLMLGTNDAFEGLTPRDTVRNLRRMATLARARGARVLILTQPPAFCIFTWNGYCQAHPEVVADLAKRTEYTREVSHLLAAVKFPSGTRVLDLRDRWAMDGWIGFTNDGLHPSAEGRGLIALWVAEELATDQ